MTTTAATLNSAVPNAAICALPMLHAALRRIESQITGKPLAGEDVTTPLPDDIEALVAFCIDRTSDVQGVVQAAFDELDKINEPETDPVARLLDEIL